jgi:hypothetical protein
MATKAKKKNTSLMRNPSTGGAAAKSNSSRSTTKKNTSARGGAAKSNPSKGRKKSSKKGKSRRYRRNPANQGIGIFKVLGGAFAINFIDYSFSRIFPTLPAFARVAVKGGAGLTLLMFGNKIPFVKKVSGLAGWAFVFAAALDGIGTWAMPYVVRWLDPTLSAMTGAVAGATGGAIPLGKAPAPTGELGMLYELPNGDQMVLVDPRMDYADVPRYEPAFG